MFMNIGKNRVLKLFQVYNSNWNARKKSADSRAYKVCFHLCVNFNRFYTRQKFRTYCDYYTMLSWTFIVEFDWKKKKNAVRYNYSSIVSISIACSTTMALCSWNRNKCADGRTYIKYVLISVYTPIDFILARTSLHIVTVVRCYLQTLSLDMTEENLLVRWNLPVGVSIEYNKRRSIRTLYAPFTIFFF